VRFIVNPFFIGLWAETHLTRLHVLRRSSRHGCGLYSRSQIPDGSRSLLVTASRMAGVTIRHKIGARNKVAWAWCWIFFTKRCPTLPKRSLFYDGGVFRPTNCCSVKNWV